ncbi:p25-alpha family protein, putative [Hepatocystis sp. ex Piliocolobus tephrosceles]|nr:p25-alpha family protein, putative [Hepatocystis sp. ex Piliocolobus tephrosceles]
MDSAFYTYTKNAPEMDSRTFVKILKDSNLLTKKLTPIEVDLAFAKYKTKGAKRINCEQFVSAIQYLVEKHKLNYEKFVATLTNEAVKGPILQGTKAENIKFYDDKSLFTGVHKHGGPTTVDKNRTQFADISELTDRSECNIRGVNVNVEKNT